MRGDLKSVAKIQNLFYIIASGIRARKSMLSLRPTGAYI
ncbi:hypothetical protein TFKS16_1080 [Tannerella forsythia KS16]|uniref:Uncharacterized protein n=1 Tax=Tannerella forsythia (strain ATCC 43037 / JCM 10827 / CCUG 21028 A / KCTC 5666 / FDC 338) TaxID=203275 RepID=G8UHR1_TANFA|nr:hypothetical protein BFO_1078 [Tannerella forsythia 92A2]BAR51355.1 hypothetical protein TFKS16_1080 [Tannerella forsythia KS16]